MNNEQRIKELKFELLELEGRELKNTEKSSNNQMGSGGVIIAIGAISLTVGLANALDGVIFMGGGAILIGILMTVAGKSNLNDFEEQKKVREERIIAIKKELITLG